MAEINMAKPGAPLGNQNATLPKRWSAAIGRALEKRGTAKIDALDALAEKLLALADAGELGALKELGDRLDGKPHQTIAAEVDASVTVEIVKYGDARPTS